jgi:hypothetical protein
MCALALLFSNTLHAIFGDREDSESIVPSTGPQAARHARPANLATVHECEAESATTPLSFPNSRDIFLLVRWR